MPERYYTELDSYKQKQYSDNPGKQHVYAILPDDFWGHAGYTAYNLSPPLDRKHYDYIFSIAIAEGFTSNDIFQGGRHSDQFLAGAGDDQITGRDHDDQLVGGSGDDLLTGSAGDDILLGDWADYPTIISTYNWTIPKQNTGISGDDQLYGGDDRDTLVGGPGDDQLFGGNGADIISGGDGDDVIDAGPRGQGNLDDVTGGAGADLFLLNYGEASDPSSSTAAEFWKNIGAPATQNAAKELVKTAVVKLGEKLLMNEAKQLPGYSGLLLGPVGGLAGAAASEGLGLLFKSLSKSPAPKSTEDVLVIRDFDPREDVIVLPIDVTKSLSSFVKLFDSSSADGNSSPYVKLDDQPRGYGISFEVDGKQFAQVFLSKDYLNALGISGKTAEADTCLQNVLNTSVTLLPNGLVEADPAFAFSGVVDASFQPPDWAANSGTQLTVFGALGPMVIRGADIAAGSNYIKLGGSNFGDFITVNETFLAPKDVLNNAAVTTNESLVYGFDGDDVIYGGNGRDFLWGGAGDDILYAFDVLVANTGNYYNGLHGDDGDDILVAGAGASAIDGGSGTDFVSYELSQNGVTVRLGEAPDLSVPAHSFPGVGQDFPGITFTGYATGFSVYDIFASIEGVIGSAFDDTVLGSGHKDFFRPGRGNDSFHGGSGADYLDYSDQADRVVVDLSAGTTQKFDGNFQDTHSSVAGLTGSAFDDTLLGHGGSNWFLFSAGDDIIDGRLGTDTLDYSATPGRVVVNVAAGTTQKFGFDDQGQEVLLGTDTFTSIEAFKGSAFNDTIYGGSFAASAAPESFAAMSMAPESVSAVSKAKAFKFHGGKGKDKVVFEGSIGDAKIAKDLSKVKAGGINATLKKIEVWKFDDHKIKAHRFDVALTNLEGMSKLKGSDAHELLVGHKTGRDHLAAGKGNDMVLGLAGDDRLLGHKGKDHLDGGAGNDRLRGGAGNDRLKGADGDDRLAGGAGANRLDGGTGLDTYVIAADGKSRKQADTIIGYEAGEKIVIKSDVLADLVGGRGPLDAKYFGLGRKAGGPNDYVVLDAARGRLLLDENGNREGGVTVLAEFRKGALPEAGDIVVA